MKKALLYILLFCICLSLTGCKTAPKKDSGAKLQGIFQGVSGDIKVDVEIEGNLIKHIELVSCSEPIEVQKSFINLSDEIISKNTISSDNLNYAAPQCTAFLEAVTNALDAAGLTEEDLQIGARTLIAKDPVVKEYTRDIVIIGAGSAGLCAAIEAKSLGVKNVTVLEKMSFAGGNTRMSGGGYGAPGNWVQLKTGILGDSPEQFFNDIYEAGNKVGSPALIRTLAEKALPDAIWLKDYVGVAFRPDQTWYSGHKFVRTLRAEGDGTHYIDTLLKKAAELGVEICYTTKAVNLLQDEKGRVTCVQAEKGGDTLKYHAEQGIILATGGFGANLEMCRQYCTQWDFSKNNILCTNSPAMTGDGLIMAQRVGAQLVDMQYIQLYPINNPATGSHYNLDYARLNSNALLVNKEGKRFVNERAARDVIAAATLEQTGKTIYELIDYNTIKEMELETLYQQEIARCYDQGVLVKGSLKECAEYFGIPLNNLIETIKRYNQFVKAGKDRDFGRENLKAIGDGYYFMFSSVVSIHHTMGGVKIDEKAHILDEKAAIIPGLYAAGEVTGGIHGYNRLGSAALTDTAVFGRIAAQTVVEESGIK